jgi:hypothetical protein
MPFQDLRSALSATPWPSDPDLPSWDDLSELNDLPRHPLLVSQIATALSVSPIVITGAANTGKTFLAYQVAHRLAAKWGGDDLEIWNAAVDQLSPADLSKVLDAKAQCAKYKRESMTSLFIVDDCHKDDDLTELFFKQASPPNIGMILVLTGRTMDDLPSWAWELKDEWDLKKKASASGMHIDPPLRRLRIDRRYAMAIAQAFVTRRGRTVEAGAISKLIDRWGVDLARLMVS